VRILILSLIALTGALPARAAEPSSFSRVMELGRLWGYAAYLHPALHDAEAAARWDGAFADAVPALLAADDDAALERAAAALLATLDDPASRLTAKSAPIAAAAPGKDPTWRDVNGVLVVDLRDPATTPDYNEAATRWRGLADAVAAARSVVFDLRTAPGATRDSRAMLAYAFVDSGVGLALSCRGLPGPAIRARAYDGFAPEQGGSSGGYQRYFELSSPAQLSTFRQPPPPATAGHPFAVFVVDADSLIPDCATALELAGKGAIVAQGGPGVPESLPVMELPIGPDHTARLRLGDAVRGDGAPWSGVDRVVNGDALAAAIDLARAGQPIVPSAERRITFPPSPAAPHYPDGDLPPPAWRVLAVAKTCMLFDLFFPYRELMTEDWDAACRGAMREVLAAADADAYRVAMAHLLRATSDSHVGLRGAALPAALGDDSPPFLMRFIEGRPVVVSRLAKAPKELAVGDEIVAIEGRPVAERIAVLRGLITSSTSQWRDGLVADCLLSGAAGTSARFTVDGAGGRREIVAARVPYMELYAPPDPPAPAFKLLEPKIGYADLTLLQPSEVDAMFTLFAGAEAIVFDLRGYPNGTAWSIAPRLSERENVPAARFERRDLRAQDFTAGDLKDVRRTTSFVQYIPPRAGAAWLGRSVMLIDERAISQSEHTGLFLRAANGTRFVGSPTAGANGDVTAFTLPGGLRVSFTGQGVRWPDGTQLQRRGLQPDVPVTPTIAGIRAGRDEVLEAALAWLRAQK
jgi:C-terminal processing protease CtpA/Prc